jgi:hypothetical protein
MDYGPNRPICRTCGRQIDRGVAPAGAGNCERCGEEASPRDGADSRRRGIVERLRGRYAEAQEWVIADSGSSSPHANLEWILGSRRGAGDGASIGTSVSELVVLWLEDLALELEHPEVADSGRGGEGSPARRAAAEELRVATRDFADAFLDPQADGCPA